MVVSLRKKVEKKARSTSLLSSSTTLSEFQTAMMTTMTTTCRLLADRLRRGGF